MPAVLHAQGTGTGTIADPPPTVPLRLGPLALAPAISLSSGWDSNVFNEEAARDDVTATARPELGGWLRLGRARLAGRSSFDFIYFHEFESERSIDSLYEGRAALSLGRLVPYVTGTWIRAKQRFGFEIDQRVRRHDQTATAGAALRLGYNTTVDVGARRKRLTFDRPPEPDPLVSEFYDYTSRGVVFTLRQRLTPLTTIGATVDNYEDRFDMDPTRDSDTLRIASVLEFKPLALISGRASLGWQRVRLVSGESPEFSGFVSSVDLAYTLLGRTRFTVQVDRDVSYSAVQGQHAYLFFGTTGAVTHRLIGGWELSGRAGRYEQDYGVFTETAASGGSQPFDPNEIVTEYGGDLGYRIRSALRIAFGVRRQFRNSTVASLRGYGRTVATMSFEYRP